jgi:hypothetical protein
MLVRMQGQKEPLHTVGGNVISTTSMERSTEAPQKTKIEATPART